MNHKFEVYYFWRCATSPTIVHYCLWCIAYRQAFWVCLCTCYFGLYLTVEGTVSNQAHLSGVLDFKRRSSIRIIQRNKLFKSYKNICSINDRMPVYMFNLSAFNFVMLLTCYVFVL